MKIPVLANDDFEPFCILKAVHTLSYLEKAVSNVFATITKKILDEQSKVSNITQRIASAQSAINDLNEPSKIITITSPSKMDGPEFPNYYSPITQFIPKIEPERVTGHSIQYNEAFTNIEYKEDETFNFQRPKIVNEQKLNSPNLGRTPEFTHSIPSLLVFGTNENPYKESFCIENFNEKKKSKNNDDDSFKIPDAPSSILSIEEMPDFGENEMIFISSKENCPAFELPENIPGLSNVTCFDLEDQNPIIEINQKEEFNDKKTVEIIQNDHKVNIDQVTDDEIEKNKNVQNESTPKESDQIDTDESIIESHSDSNFFQNENQNYSNSNEFKNLLTENQIPPPPPPPPSPPIPPINSLVTDKVKNPAKIPPKIKNDRRNQPPYNLNPVPDLVVAIKQRARDIAGKDKVERRKLLGLPEIQNHEIEEIESEYDSSSEYDQSSSSSEWDD